LIVIEHPAIRVRPRDGGVRLPRFARCCQRGPVLLYSPGTDTFLEDLTRNANRVFYFNDGPIATKKLIAKAYPKAQKSQTTLELGHDQIPVEARDKIT
jgi:hypothetical protein